MTVYPGVGLCRSQVRRIDAAFQQQAGDGDAADVAPHPLSIQIRILQEHEKTKLQMVGARAQTHTHPRVRSQVAHCSSTREARRLNRRLPGTLCTSLTIRRWPKAFGFRNSFVADGIRSAPTCEDREPAALSLLESPWGSWCREHRESEALITRGGCGGQTATLQVLRKAHTAGAWEWQRGPAGLPPPPPPSSEDADAPPANAQSWRRCACEAPDCTQQPPDPTEEEYTSAVEEATKKLEAAVQGVNEVLEELRYEMEEE